MALTGPDPSVAELSLAIRQSPLLDGALKRRWLAVLPHLSPTDRARLAAILGSAESDPQ